MIRTIAGFKTHVALGLCSIALISAACSDDNDDVPGGSAGTSGAGTAGKATGGSAGATAGTGNGGSTAGSATTAGTSNGAGMDGGGTSGNAGGNAGESAGGMGGDTAVAGQGGQGGSGVEGGAGGEGAQGGASEGGASGEGGWGGEGGAPIVFDVLDNPGFEAAVSGGVIPGWTNEGTPGAAFVQQSDPHTGFARLGHWTQWVDNTTPPYTARTFQTVGPIPNGTYSFSIWVDRGWFQEQYLFARGHDVNDPTAQVTISTAAAETPAGYVKITLSGIVVTSGTCTVGVYSAAPAGTYTNFDDAELTLE